MCMRTQYSNYIMRLPNGQGWPNWPTGLNLNIDIQLAEYIAENGGVKASYNAYSEYPQDTQWCGYDDTTSTLTTEAWEARQVQKEARLPGLEDYSPQQMFWISGAQAWCEEYKTDSMTNQARNKKHPPGMFRVQVGHFAHFSINAFLMTCYLGIILQQWRFCKRFWLRPSSG